MIPYLIIAVASIAASVYAYCIGHYHGYDAGFENGMDILLEPDDEDHEDDICWSLTNAASMADTSSPTEP